MANGLVPCAEIRREVGIDGIHRNKNEVQGSADAGRGKMPSSSPEDAPKGDGGKVGGGGK